MRRLCALVTLFAISVVPALGHSESEAVRHAKVKTAEAKKLFNLGRFTAAAEAYEAAYGAIPAPALLYNMGQCQKRIGGLAGLNRAAFYYEAYLKNAPGAPNATDVRVELSELKSKIAELERAPKAAPPPAAVDPVPALEADPLATPPPEATGSPPWYKRWWVWTLVGVAAAGAGAATYFATRPDAIDPVRGTLAPGQVQFP